MGKYMFTYGMVEEVQSSEKLVVAGLLAAGILALREFGLTHSTKFFSCIFAKFSPNFLPNFFHVEFT
jgi:hypothetical protein